MAIPFNPGNGDGSNFKPVQKHYDILSGARTQAEGGMVYPTGRTPLNVKATQIMDRLAVDAGQNVQQYNIQCEVDEINHLVACSVATQVGPGVLPVRRSSNGRSIAVHLGGAFEECPLIRPASKRKCQVWLGKDSNGRPSLIISLGTGLSARTNPRPESESK